MSRTCELHGVLRVLACVCVHVCLCLCPWILVCGSTGVREPTRARAARFTAPHGRRRGAARAVCTALLERVRLAGATGVIILPAIDNAAARHMYESLGFVLSGTYPSEAMMTSVGIPGFCRMSLTFPAPAAVAAVAAATGGGTA